MIFTIDTLNKTITLHGSFTYEDFAAFRYTLPKEWREGYKLLVPVESLTDTPKQIEQKQYPVGDVYRGTDVGTGCGCGANNDRSCDC